MPHEPMFLAQYLYSEDDIVIQEWNDAIDEFDANGGDPSQTEAGQLFDKLLVELEEEIESLVVLFGLTTDAFLNTPLLPHAIDNSLLSPTAYQALCVARTHRALRSIRCLLNEHMGEDVLKLARSIYENYLHIIFIAAHPQKTKDLR